MSLRFWAEVQSATRTTRPARPTRGSCPMPGGPNPKLEGVEQPFGDVEARLDQRAPRLPSYCISGSASTRLAADEESAMESPFSKTTLRLAVGAQKEPPPPWRRVWPRRSLLAGFRWGWAYGFSAERAVRALALFKATAATDFLAVLLLNCFRPLHTCTPSAALQARYFRLMPSIVGRCPSRSVSARRTKVSNAIFEFRPTAAKVPARVARCPSRRAL